MFLVTSVTMQRERGAGILERLWTIWIHRVDLIGGYAVAFGFIAFVQSLFLVLTLRYFLGVETQSEWWINHDHLCDHGNRRRGSGVAEFCFCPK